MEHAAPHGLHPPQDSAARAARDERQSGYSLVEVLAAAAILAGVLLAIMGMFVYGGRSVNSGKMLTRATSIATDVLEEFRKYSFQQTYQVIEDGGTPAVDTRYTWNSISNSPNYPSDPEYVATLTAWKTTVESVSTGLPSGEMTITVRALQDLGTGSADPVETNFNAARLLQVVVSVKWKQAKRSRSVVFETFKS
jgi:prepilin-type N-terminal cleavage/methylation domain-containing protein